MSRCYIDRGGTFMDVVHVDEAGAVRIEKIRSDTARIGEHCSGDLVFGTTVATNALLERTGVPTLLITHEGLADLPWIRDMARPEIFDPDARRAPPLCDHVLEIEGRISSRGVELEPIQVDRIRLAQHLRAGIRSVAIVLLHSQKNPAHENEVARIIAAVCEEESIPAPFLALGHQNSPKVGFLAKLDATLIDASITPRLQDSMVRDQIPAGSKAIRSDGSLCPSEELSAPDAVLSGPSGGVLAVAAIAKRFGFKRAVGLDMGGTSTDVCRVDVGTLPRREGQLKIAGVHLDRPVLEVETIAAGGGSILRDDGVRMTVGPDSAGADPGPQCYARGGPPTLTDAALALGRIDPTKFTPPLDPDSVSLPGDPSSFMRIGQEAMAQAIRKIATARGIDVRDHVLIAYGGAAGQHAAEVASLLKIETVIVHPLASVFSAFGMTHARDQEHKMRALWIPLRGGWPEAKNALQGLLNQLPTMDETRFSLELRHVGTDHAISIDIDKPETTTEAGIATQFREAHFNRYGFHRPDLSVEITNAHARVLAKAQELVTLPDEQWELPSAQIDGPARLSNQTTSVWVPDGWVGNTRDGCLFLTPKTTSPVQDVRHRTPEEVQLWGARFMSVAEQAGEVLRRLARSVNVRDRLDFSCAVFDTDGLLVANAPHIPVHLGAMGQTVQDLIQSGRPLTPGQSWLCNDPSRGGSHLPDLTVTSIVYARGHRFFVANRAHHVDVGGATPGSMPPNSTTLSDEGFVATHIPLLDDGVLSDLSPILRGCRQEETVRADLEAQIAANQHAARLLLELGPPDLIQLWMGHLQDVAAELVRPVLRALPNGAATDTIDGVPLSLRVGYEDGRLLVDFTGTGGPHPGNLNAPRAVVHAAILYALRSLTPGDVPLNAGTLKDVTFKIPYPSILSPPEGCAVVGGNVETSQRIVDLFFEACLIRASSQGTMNNLSLGGHRADGSAWSLYETIGGGAGASDQHNGQSGLQVHMTNTRATDLEILESRLPLLVRSFRFRAKSGGSGRRSGGLGLIRELELCSDAQMSLLATRRTTGARGLLGGGPGLPGCDLILRNGVAQAWDGTPTTGVAGDRVRIETPGGGGHGPEPVKQA